VADAGLDVDRISGVCVGLPGVVERASGRCRQSPIFRETDVPFGAELSSRLGIAVTVDSDVNLVTLAEHWFGHGRGLDDFLVVSIEHSLGLGIMHNGELFRGASGLSPDLGDLFVRHPGVDGHNAPDRLAAIVATATSRNGNAGGRPLGADTVDGDEAAYKTIADALGVAIANLVTLFAPPKVILAGAAISAGDRLLKPLRAVVADLTPPRSSSTTGGMRSGRAAPPP